MAPQELALTKELKIMQDLIHEVLNDHLVVLGEEKVIRQEDLITVSKILEKILSEESAGCAS